MECTSLSRSRTIGLFHFLLYYSTLLPVVPRSVHLTSVPPPTECGHLNQIPSAGEGSYKMILSDVIGALWGNWAASDWKSREKDGR